MFYSPNIKCVAGQTEKPSGYALKDFSMTHMLVEYLEQVAVIAATWGPLLVLLFMTVESSFIPFPSEVVMIPAGFLAARSELFPGDPEAAFAIAVACGLAGSMLGAYINYGLSWWLGRPFLHKYGRYFF